MTTKPNPKTKRRAGRLAQEKARAHRAEELAKKKLIEEQQRHKQDLGFRALTALAHGFFTAILPKFGEGAERPTPKLELLQGGAAAPEDPRCPLCGASGNFTVEYLGSTPIRCHHKEKP